MHVLTLLVQIPRIDIGAPANAIEYHPALLAHAEENGGVAPPERCTVADLSEVTPSSAPSNGELSEEDSIEGSDVSSDYGDISTDDDIDSLDSEMDGFEALSPADRAEQERFGADYSGPRLEDREASRLLILMAHASTCPCQHTSHRHAETCRSTKWMMLHVRDCPGTTSNFDVCPFPWCRKVKHLLYHLVSCEDPESCHICAPADIGKNLVHLKAHSEHRLKAYRRTLLAKLSSSSKKTATATPSVPSPAPPTPQAKGSTVAQSSQSASSQSTAPAASVAPLQANLCADPESNKSDAPLSEGTNSAPASTEEPMPSTEETKSSPPPVLDHPGATNRSLLVDESEKDPMPQTAKKVVTTKIKQEPRDEPPPMAPEHKSEPAPTNQSSVETPTLNAEGKKTSGDGSTGKEKQPDAENTAVVDGRDARANSVAVKTEEPEAVVPDAAATSEFGAGEKTSEPLKVQ